MPDFSGAEFSRNSAASHTSIKNTFNCLYPQYEVSCVNNVVHVNHEGT